MLSGGGDAGRAVKENEEEDLSRVVGEFESTSDIVKDEVVGAFSSVSLSGENSVPV